ncbi:MAG: PQQ-dependent sugar dehydrogenase [Pirellulales bacterium]
MQLTGLDMDAQGGLHSLAFHPDYAPGVAGSKMYIVALRPSGTPEISTSHLEEWVLNGSGTPTYNRTLLEVIGRQEDDATHAMDWIGFKPGATGAEKDWLYVTNGDGGIQVTGSGYVNNSQDLNSLYGKVLRLGVGGGDDHPDGTRNYEFTPTIYHNDDETLPNGPGATAPEVLYSGFRNPWRASFDRGTGDFWLGDVGNTSREEINYVAGGVIGRDSLGNPAAPGSGAANGLDFGWSRREGTLMRQGDLDPDGPAGIRPNSIDPLVSFPHSGGADFHISITGGYVYRGPNQDPAIQGKYFWSDAYSNKAYVSSLVGGVLQYQNVTSQYTASLAGTDFALHRIVSYAEDSAGDLYLIDFGVPGGASSESGWTGARAVFGTGEIYKISYGAIPPPTPVTVREPTVTHRDDFESSHDYATGTVPVGGIWNDVHNPTFGQGDTFTANITNSGQLTIGMEPVGWDVNGVDTAPTVVRQVNAENLMEIRAKVTQQTVTSFSVAGLLVRDPGPIDHNGANDNFVTANAFRASGTDNRLQIANYISGAEDQENAAVASPNDLTYLRLVHNGQGEYTAYSSSDGENWIQRGSPRTNSALATGLVEVGLWAGNLAGGSSTGTTQFDWVQIILGVPAGDYNEDGFINAADYTVWRNTIGEPAERWDGADGDGDGIITEADYVVWKNNYGKTIPNLGSGSGGDAAAVPEPTAIALLITSMAAMPLWHRRKRRFR